MTYISCEYVYRKDGRRRRGVFKESYEDKDFHAEYQIKQDNGVKRVKLTIKPTSELELIDLYLRFDFGYQSDQRIFVNGYQSWTDSREFFPDEKMPRIAKLAGLLRRSYQLHRFGDYTFHRYRGSGYFHGYTYSYIRKGDHYMLIGSLSERQGFTVIEHQVPRKTITIRKDCKGLRIDDVYHAFDLVLIEGGEDFVFDRYFDALHLQKARCKPATGWTSWYQYYQNINETIILDNLNQFRQRRQPIEIFQIDDGYQTAVGDWLSVDTKKFPNGMKDIAASIKECGYKPGIWLAPFICERESKIFKEKGDWLFRDGRGRPIPAGSNWSGSFVLDFYNPEVQAYLRRVFNVVLNDWGYDLVKLDFLYAVCLVPRPRKTRGQIMMEAMEFLRECVGEKMILGCGVPLGPAFGMVDYCRIGSDVGLDWNDKFYMKYLCRERISTFNAIGNSMGRRHLDKRAFLNDPDVFLLRDERIQLSQDEKYTLFVTNWLFGSLLFTSDYIGNYTPEKERLFEIVLKATPRKVESVERRRNGLVEVLFYEEGLRRLALMNLGEKKVQLENRWGEMVEVRLGEERWGDPAYGMIQLEVHQSKIFNFNDPIS